MRFYLKLFVQFYAQVTSIDTVMALDFSTELSNGDKLTACSQRPQHPCAPPRGRCHLGCHMLAAALWQRTMCVDVLCWVIADGPPACGLS